MRFLIDADLPRSVSEVLQRHKHQAVDVRDVGLRSAKDSQIARYAQIEKLCVITGDFDFADIRNYPPSDYYGIIVLSLPRKANAAYINQLLDNFLEQDKVLEELSGKLAIIEAGRVRIRE